MKHEDLPVYAYFQLEDYGWDDVKELPGADEDELGEWDPVACKLVVDHFCEACRNLWPLIENRLFKGISLGIDLLGSSGGMASYYHNHSKVDTGNYGFSVSYEVLREYLAAYFNDKHVLSPHIKYMWEHEVIHMGDHRNLTEFRFNLRSTDDREFLIHYLLSYRYEGIADLWFYMNGHGPVKEPEVARQKFLGDIKRFDSIPWEDESLSKKNEYESMATYLFYSVGPWIVLHALCCSANEVISTLAGSVAGRITDNEEISREEMTFLIMEAVKISNEDFIMCLTKPGLGCKPFIETGIIELLAHRLGKIDHKREIHPGDEEYNRVNDSLVKFYNKIWPENRQLPNKISYDRARRNIKMGPEEGKRFKKLGDFGEALANEILEENGFKNITNLNHEEMNFQFADFYAEIDSTKYLISVKTRNKYESSGKLNSRYKLGRNLLTRIEKALSLPEFSKCEPAWLAIAMEEKTCDAYFGLISKLEGGNGIPMSKKACSTNQCLALNRPHKFDSSEFLNKYEL